MDTHVHAFSNHVLATPTFTGKIHHRRDSRQRKPKHRLATSEHNLRYKQANRYKHPGAVEKFCRA